MHTSLFKLSLSQKLLGLFLINISILSVILLNSYFFSEKHINDLEYVEEKMYDITSLHSENFHLLESMINSFTDATITNEFEILNDTTETKADIVNNLKRLEEYGEDINEIENKLESYFVSAYSFTFSVLSNGVEYDFKEAMAIQQSSADIVYLFREKKENSRKNMIQKLNNISRHTKTFFHNELNISFIGLSVMIAFGLFLHFHVKTRFTKIIRSVKNLTQQEPDFSIRLKDDGVDEISEIVYLFNKLEDKLEKAHEQSSAEFLEEIEHTQKEVVFTMGSIAESRSKETGNHVKRVAEYTKLLALKYGLNEDEAELLKQASPMHDIGKVAIPDAILNKPGRFTEEERVIMDTHAQLGYEMLKHSERPLLKMAAIVAYEHHEKWDGSGYPNARKGEDIHIYGRITALADVFDALGSDRVYKKAWDDARIFSYFKEESGKHFDPRLIDIFFENLESFLEIRDRFKD